MTEHLNNKEMKERCCDELGRRTLQPTEKRIKPFCFINALI